MQTAADGLAHPTSDAVAYGSGAKGARRRETDPGLSKFRFTQAKCGKHGTRNASPVVINSSEFRVSE